MFSQNLKYLRNKHDMEQIDLAHKLGKKSASSISEWEKGKYTPKIKTLNDIASIFNVTINDLMSVDLSSENKQKQPQQDTIAAHLDGDDFTEDEIKKIREFADIVRKARKG